MNTLESRLKMSAYNATFSVISNFVNIILSFTARTLFIKILGETLLGVDGLFTNILSILSFTELGIGTAMNFYLYKPIADNDEKKIKSLMFFYRKAYRIIAIVVFCLGMAIYPCLNLFVKNDGNIENINIYYLVFLFNTVISYLATSRNAIINCLQKGYILTIFSMVFNVVRVSAQIIVLIFAKSYLPYLICSSFVELIHKFAVYFYIGKKYPQYSEKNADKLDNNELASIWKDVRALIMHKFGEIMVTQTDNIIISIVVNVATVGLISNYNMIITTITTVITLIINAVIPSLGNLIAKKGKDSCYRIFKSYRLITFFLYGFSSIALLCLLTPFITIWLGEEYIVHNDVIFLIIFNYYMLGHRAALQNVKIAAGAFVSDKYISILQGIINLVASVVFAHYCGLIGVYVGTVIQGAFSAIIRPILLYPVLFDVPFIEYFKDSFKYLAQLLVIGGVLIGMRDFFLSEVTVLSFSVYTVLVGLIAVVLLLVFNFRSEEFKYIYQNIIKVLFRNNKAK